MIPAEELQELGLGAMAPTPEMEAEMAKTKEYENELMDFSKFVVIGKELKNQWSQEISRTEEARELRKFECDPEAMRERNEIGEDETYVADRVIDTNIKREQPAFLNFLTAARNVVTFTRKDNMSSNEVLEEKFTRGAKYVGWEMPFIKEVDGTSAMGWDAVEVIYDESKPLKFAIEHIGHDKLFFAYGSQELNVEEVLLREYDVTCSQLRSWVKKVGFNQEVVDTILEGKKASPQKRFENQKVYKVYFKLDDVVYIAWCSFDGAAKDWLKAPEKLRLGIKEQVMQPVEIPLDAPPEVQAVMAQQPPTAVWQDQDVVAYPVFILVYNQGEEKEITKHLGRVHIDLPMQEASTTLWTAQTNQAVRSSYMMFSADGAGDGTGSAAKQTQMKIGNGMMVDKPMKQFKLDEPTGNILKLIQALKMQNNDAAGQTLQAALQKGPSARTTGIEIDTAKEQQAQLSMINLLMFSMHIRDVYTYGWKITQSQILQGNLWEGQFQPEDIDTEYELRAGGDTDVIQRSEKLNRMMQFWSIVATTPIAPAFLTSMLQLAFPTECAPWVDMLKSQDPRMVAAMLSDVIRATLTPEEMQGLGPEQVAVLTQAMQQAEGYKKQIAAPSAPKNDNAPAPGAPITEDNKPPASQ
jgi:hypothetical protein